MFEQNWKRTEEVSHAHMKEVDSIEKVPGGI